MAVPRKFRLHLEQRDGLLRNAAKLSFGSDGSVYLVPYARREEFFYGGRTMPAGDETDTFNFREQISAESKPKLSIHRSGQVHIYANDQRKAGPVFTPPLEELRGEHVATVLCDLITSVPEFRGTPSTTGEQRDLAFGVPPDIQSCALLIYANGVENAFRVEELQIAFQVERRDKPPIFIGVAAVAKEPLADQDDAGVTVLAGFDARKRPDEPSDYLYLRGL